MLSFCLPVENGPEDAKKVLNHCTFLFKKINLSMVIEIN